MRCGISGKILIGTQSLVKRFNIHHKDMNRKNNTPQNLITLCPSCHRREHAKLCRIRMFLREQRFREALRTKNLYDVPYGKEEEYAIGAIS
jgi:hypothetical protein